MVSLIIVGGLALAILPLVLLLFIAGGGPRYDERQVKIRARAFQIGYTVLFIYLVVLVLLGINEIFQPIHWPMLVVLGVLLSSTMIQLLMIWQDAFVQVGGKRISSAVMDLFLGAMWLATYFPNRDRPDPTPVLHVMTLALGIHYLLTGASLLLKSLLDRLRKE